MTQISLQEITFETVRSIVRLEVSQHQAHYVAPNADSLAEAQFNPGAWFRAIYVDDYPIGFAMLFDPSVPGAIARGPISPREIGLWRFMIDHRFQRKGFGRRALDLVVDHARRATNASSIISSYVPGPEGPEAFYMAYGFQKTGRLRNGGREVEIALPL